MNVQIVRHRATRRSVFGILYFKDLEIFTLERRSDMLDQGSHMLTFNSDKLAIGDHPVSGDSRKEGKAGYLIVGLQANSLSLSETGNAMEKLKRELGNIAEPVHVEVVDSADYDAVE